MKVKVAQSCPTLCRPMDSTVHGIHQARILEWVAYPFSSGSSWPRNQTRVSCIAGRFFTNWGKVRSRIMDPWRSLCPEIQNLSVCDLIAVLVSGGGLVTNSYFFVTPWTVALQAPLSGISQARILEWVAISSSRISSQTRYWTCVSCVGRRILYHWVTWEAQYGRL